MPSPQDEIEALKSQIASLTARVYQLETQRGAAPSRIPAVEPPSPSASGPTAPPFVPVSPPHPLPHAPATHSLRAAARATRDDTDLEKKIGQYWLNRIGIVAM